MPCWEWALSPTPTGPERKLRLGELRSRGPARGQSVRNTTPGCRTLQQTFPCEMLHAHPRAEAEIMTRQQGAHGPAPAEDVQHAGANHLGASGPRPPTPQGPRTPSCLRCPLSLCASCFMPAARWFRSGHRRVTGNTGSVCKYMSVGFRDKRTGSPDPASTGRPPFWEAGSPSSRCWPGRPLLEEEGDPRPAPPGFLQLTKPGAPLGPWLCHPSLCLHLHTPFLSCVCACERERECVCSLLSL